MPKDDSLASLDYNKKSSRNKVDGKPERRYASQLHSYHQPSSSISVVGEVLKGEQITSDPHTPLPEIVQNKRYANHSMMDIHEIQPTKSKKHSRASMPLHSGEFNSSEVVLYKSIGESDGPMASIAESFPEDLTFKIEDFHEPYPSKEIEKYFR